MDQRVVIVGGGLIGLACAWRAAEAGHAVTVVDPHPASGASRVAAGMLAPVTEVTYGEEDYLGLTLAAAARWPAFVETLEAATGDDVDYRTDGTLLVGFDTDDIAVIEDLRAFQGELGLRVERLSSRACRAREPLLSPRVRGGLHTTDDHRVDPRRVLAALRRAVDGVGVRHVAEQVATVDHGDGRVHGVTTAAGTHLDADRVVLAAGSWSSLLSGLPEAAVPPLRAVKGQLLILRTLDGTPALTATVRGIVRGRSVYLVPRGDGRLIVGATQEERGFDTTVTAGGVRELLDDAVRIVPGVDELAVAETLAGLRPTTPDHRPLIGDTALDGLLLATGHFRNGVLLAPLTAEAIAARLADQPADPLLAVADPRRFALGSGTPATDPPADATPPATPEQPWR